MSWWSRPWLMCFPQHFQLGSGALFRGISYVCVSWREVLVVALVLFGVVGFARRR